MHWRSRLLILVGLAALAAPVVAGDAVKLRRGAGQLKLSLDTSLAASWKEVNVGRLVMQTPARQRRLDLVPLAKSADLEVDLAEAETECVLVLAELGPAEAKGFADSWQRVTRVSKLVVCPEGDGPDALAARRRAGAALTAKTGSRIEVRALVNPSTVRSGKDLLVQVYYEGTAQANVDVTASGPEGASVAARTNNNGIAILRISAGGEWTARYSTVRGEETHEASLAFDVLNDTVWQSVLEGGA